MTCTTGKHPPWIRDVFKNTHKSSINNKLIIFYFVTVCHVLKPPPEEFSQGCIGALGDSLLGLKAEVNVPLYKSLRTLIYMELF